MKTYHCILMATLVATISVTGCKSAKTVYVPVESVRTEYKDKLQRDSIYLSDSVLIYKSGDTVYQTKTRYFFRNFYSRDTVARVDSIRVPYPVETVREVNRLKWWQEGCVWFTGAALLLGSGYFGRGLLSGLLKRPIPFI